VVILNVLGFYDPLRALIRNAVNSGLIQPFNEQLIIFVDGPSERTRHLDFDWGAAALAALSSWQKPNEAVYKFDWTLVPPGKGEKRSPVQAI
jgi:hypothetical protein